MPSQKNTPKTKCVCCNALVRKNKSHLIFDEYGKFRRIQFLLAECLNKNVTETADGQPTICTECLNQLDQNYAFKLKCAKTNDNEDIANGVSDEQSMDESMSSDDELLVEAQPKEFGNIVENDIQSSAPSLQVKVEGDCPMQCEDYGSGTEYVFGENETAPISNHQPDEQVELNNCVSEDMYTEKYENCSGNSETIASEPALHQESAEYLDAMFTDATEMDVLSELSTEANRKPMTLATSFVESLTVHSIKDIIRKGIPTHCLKLTEPPALIQNDDTLVPKLRIEPVDESEPVDIDEYVLAIASVSFCEFSPFENQPHCQLCPGVPVYLENYTALVQHTREFHSDNQAFFECCLGECNVCTSQADLNNHYFLQHSDIINACTFLTCQTCNMVTESLVKFGKHVCFVDSKAEPPVVDNNYQCNACDTNLISRRRSFFHQQFHLENARPKLCLICDLVFRDEHTFYEHAMFTHDEFAQYFCRFCDKSFTIESELRRHEHSHTAIRSFACDECDKAFFDQQTLNAHKLIHQPGFTCEHCNKHYSRKSRLRKHIMSVHVQYKPAILPLCELCGRVFANEDKANRHWSACQQRNDDDECCAPGDQAAPLIFEYFEKVLCCEYCEVAFEDLAKLLEHKKRQHSSSDLKFECQYCEYRYDQYSRLKTHSSSHAEAKQRYPVRRLYVCEIDGCHKPYSDWNTFQMHRKTVHLINPSIINCTLCDAVFYKSWAYNYHKKSVHNVHHKCPCCDQTFVIEQTLKNHMRKMHSGGGDDERPEDEPDNADAEQQHQLTATQRKSKHDALIKEFFQKNGNGEWSCVVCDKVSNRRSNAIAHAQMMHLKIRNFKCTLCPKEFFHRGDLNGHMRKHNLDRPYKCPHCEHAARNKSMLTFHLRKHTNERPYKCDQCPKAFKRSMVLKNHQKLHGDKDIQCELCDATFYTNYARQNHHRHKHVECENDRVQRRAIKKEKPNVKYPPSTIIVMPGPQSDRKEDVGNGKLAIDHKSQMVYVLKDHRKSVSVTNVTEVTTR